MPYRPPRIIEPQSEAAKGPGFGFSGDFIGENRFNAKREKAPMPRMRRARRGTVKSLNVLFAYILSMGAHVVAPVGLLALNFILFLVLDFFGIELDLFQKPTPPKPKDIEFVLAPSHLKEETPINPKTHYRADKNMRAAGQNDPNQPVNIEEKPKTVAAAVQPAQAPPERIVIKPKKTVTPPKQQPKKPAPQQDEAPVSNLALSKPPTPEAPQQPSQQNNAIANAGQAAQGSQPSVEMGALSNPQAGGNITGAPSVDALKEPDFGPYMKDLQTRIKMSWRPPRGNESKRVVVVFQIDKNGVLKDVKVSKSSGEPSADQAAIAAIQRVFPYRPLPSEYAEEDIDIEFTFDYNVFGDKQRLSRHSGNG